MQNQTITKVKFEIEPWSWRGSRIQCAQINERCRALLNHDRATIDRSAQPVSPAVETRCTDPFVSAERLDARSAGVKLRQQQTPLALVASLPLALPISRHRFRPRRCLVAEAIVLNLRATTRTPVAYRLPLNFLPHLQDSTHTEP